MKTPSKTLDTPTGRTKTVRDGGGEQQFNEALSHAVVFPNHTGLHLEGAKEFFYWPRHGLPYDRQLKPQLDKIATHGWVMHHLDESRTRFQSPYSLLEYDRSTGFVHQFYFHAPAVQMYSERLQYEPMMTESGIPLAKVFATISFPAVTGDPPPVSVFHVYIIRDAKINFPVDAGEFVLPVPEGTLVQLYGPSLAPGSPQPASEVTTTDIPNAREFVSRPGFGERIP